MNTKEYNSLYASIITVDLFKGPLFLFFENSVSFFIPGYSHNSTLYTFYIVFISILSIITFIKQRKKFSFFIWIIICYALVINTIGCINLANYKPELVDFYYYFIVFSLPEMLWGPVVANDNQLLLEITKKIKIIVIILIFECFINNTHYLLYNMSASSNEIVIYQMLSYYSAFAFGMIGYYVGIEKKTIMKSIFALMMIFLFISTMFGGGRGAFVLLLVYVFILMFYSGVENVKLFLQYLGIVLLMIFFITYMYNKNVTIRNGISRALSFLDFGTKQVVWSESSGRDAIYQDAINCVMQKPFLGYGPWGYLKELKINVYPHNIVLELWLGYGVIFGSVIYLICILSIISCVKKNRFLLFLACYPLVSLLFSGSYKDDSVFIFILFYSFQNKRLKKRMLLYD